METDVKKLPLLPDEGSDYDFICTIIDYYDGKLPQDIRLEELADSFLTKFHQRTGLWIDAHKSIGDL